ncbi:DUF2807 domain-containing protein [Hymenobacter weizhouensis]|uniref:DUF2807 domain-containing protein n=1 Tax=Hymenobacter sp. YIM 151500-1 TaxID=2987689 RepID=UPI002226365F|nr:DUF2807 domain-containing protein [Hymenobacter sp. YIM 151500-1]UYZ64579.1 DUF2807 domain-containing protein [Hymenobacter sp. YIM 151500-1]
MRTQGNAPRRLLRAKRTTGLLPLLALLLAACSKENEAGCFTSTGSIVTERRSLPPFNQLTTYDNVQVTLVQDTATYAEVKAGKNLQEDIRLTVENGHLTVRNTSRCNWVRRYDTPREVTLHVPRLHGLWLWGQADIRTQGTFRADTIFYHLTGSGNYDLTVDSRYLWLDQYELGDIRVRGRADELHLTVGGKGSTYAQGLTARTADFRTNQFSTGNAHLTVTELLSGIHASLGTIFYRPAPTLRTEVQVTGKGKMQAE